MIVLSCSNISKSFIGESILEDITFAINDGEKVGLVGLNGAGKSTLFRILTDQISKDSGNMFLAKDCKLGYLEQNTGFESDATIFEEALKIFEPLIAMEKKLRDLEKRISHSSQHTTKDEDLDGLMTTYAHLSETFANKNGYGYESEIRGVLKGLGFIEDQFDQPIHQLSGGQKTRVTLAKLLLEKPDVLLLDEPTNHLDLQAIDWLEKYIKDYRGAALIISHDRFFLDATVSKIFHLENHRLTSYNGNYSTYMEKRKTEMAHLQKRYDNQQKEISRQEAIIRNLSLGGKRAIRQAQSRQKMLDKTKKIEGPNATHHKANIRFEPKVKSGNDVLFAEDLSKSFDEEPLFRDVSFRIYRGEKVGLIGPNGIGKSTLFKIIMGLLSYNEGAIQLGHHVNVAYFDQEQADLNPDKTIVDEIWDDHPTFDHYKVRKLLAQFLFVGDDIFKVIGDLSGGERSRLALLKLMLSQANFLLMDEPTNHLDIDSKEILEDALLNYDGTLFVISHDRYFLNKVTDKILDLSKDGVDSYLGNYKYYMEKKQELNNQEDEMAPTKTKTQLKAQKKKERERQKEERQRKKRMKYLEEAISKHEEQIEALETLMCDPKVYTDPERSQELHDESKTIRDELEALYEEWLELTEG